MEREPLKILWANSAHLEYWEGYFEDLEENYGFKITELPSIQDKEILENLGNQDAVVIHCGTVRPLANLRDLILTIKKEYPDIKVGLESEVKHPFVEDVVDFYVLKLGEIDDLSKLLRNGIE